MKVIKEDDRTYFELETENGENLEAIEGGGLPEVFDVSCEDGTLEALVACLAVQAGLRGRYHFRPIYGQEGGTGFELIQVGKFAGGVVVSGEFGLPDVSTQPSASLSEPKAS
jgi:hypothetical protein